MGLKEAQQILQSKSSNDSIKKSHKLSKLHELASSVDTQKLPLLDGKPKAVKILLGILIYSLLFFLYVTVSGIFLFMLPPSSNDGIDYAYIIFSFITVFMVVLIIPAISTKLYGNYLKKSVFIILVELFSLIILVVTSIAYASGLAYYNPNIPTTFVIRGILSHPMFLIIWVPLSVITGVLMIVVDPGMLIMVLIFPLIFYLRIRIKSLRK